MSIALLLSPYDLLTPSQSFLARCAPGASEPCTVICLYSDQPPIEREALSAWGISQALYHKIDEELASHDDAMLPLWCEAIKASGANTIWVQQTPYWSRQLPHIAVRLGLQTFNQVVAIRADAVERSLCAGQWQERFERNPHKGFCAALLPHASVEHGAAKQAPVPSAPIHLAWSPPSTGALRYTLLENIGIAQRAGRASDCIVAGGRGLGKEGFTLLAQLAEALQCEMGATRTAVELGYCDASYQIGQSGKTVAPERYVAFGISGSIQHLAGMRQAREIIAVNTDSNAPIFQHADYGILGDARQCIEEVLACL